MKRNHRKSSKSCVYEVVVTHWPKTPGPYKYAVEVPALPGCVSDGRTREEALENIKEAIQLYLESLDEKGIKQRDLVEVSV